MYKALMLVTDTVVTSIYHTVSSIDCSFAYAFSYASQNERSVFLCFHKIVILFLLLVYLELPALGIGSIKVRPVHQSHLHMPKNNIIYMERIQYAIVVTATTTRTRSSTYDLATT